MIRPAVLLLSFLLSCIVSPAQSLNEDVLLDTIKKENGTYIELNGKDTVYDALPLYFRSEFNMLHFPWGTCSGLKKFDRQGLPCNWFEMAFYKKKFYTVIVSPDDIGMRQITDSTVVCYYNDGPQPSRIISFEHASKNIYSITYSGCGEGSRSTGTLNVYITDEKTMQAIFEWQSDDQPPSYSMMVCEERIRSYPAIVKASVCCRTGPFQGDKPSIPFREMIRQVKIKDARSVEHH